MKRTLVVVAMIGAAALGLTACSGGSEPAPEPETTVSTPVPEEVPGDDDDVAEDEGVSAIEACMSLTEPLQQANLAMAAILQESTSDPQSAVDSWRALATAFEDFGKTATDTEVAQLATAVGEDGHALTDALQKVYVDGDFSATSEFTTANDAFFASYQELLGLCN